MPGGLHPPAGSTRFNRPLSALESAAPRPCTGACARKARMLRICDPLKAWIESALAEKVSSVGLDPALAARGAFCIGYLLPAKLGWATGLATLRSLPLRCASANGMAQRERSRSRKSVLRRRGALIRQLVFTVVACRWANVFYSKRVKDVQPFFKAP